MLKRSALSSWLVWAGLSALASNASAQTTILTVNNTSGAGDIADFQISAANRVQIDSNGNIIVTGNATNGLITVNDTSAVTHTLANTTAAGSSSPASSPLLSFSGNYWNGTSSSLDSWTIQDSIGTGTNGTATLSISHSGSPASQVNLFNGSFAINGSGGLKTINGISTAGTGAPIIQGTPINLTGQSASLGTQTLLGSTPTLGSYSIHYYVDQSGVCSGAPTVSFTFNWTDATAARASSTGNLPLQSTQSTSLFIQGNLNIWAASGSAISFTSTVGGTISSCRYDVHAWVDESQ